jgi:hypothetical protein
MVQWKGLYCLMIVRFARMVWVYSQKSVAPAEVWAYFNHNSMKLLDYVFILKNEDMVFHDLFRMINIGMGGQFCCGRMGRWDWLWNLGKGEVHGGQRE